ncbi:MAG: hypothetical protein ABJM06_05670 [Gilvibacter sp.]
MKQLKTFLRINSVFSLTTGVLMAHFSDQLLSFFAIENNLYLFDAIGINLIVFALFVWYVSIKQLQNEMLVKLISFLDILWVVGSAIIVVFGLFNLSKNGYILIGIVAVWIGFLAYNQLKLILQ